MDVGEFTLPKVGQALAGLAGILVRVGCSKFGLQHSLESGPMSLVKDSDVRWETNADGRAFFLSSDLLLDFT